MSVSVWTIVAAALLAAAAVVAAFIVGVDAGASAVAAKWLELHPEDEGVRLNDKGSIELH